MSVPVIAESPTGGKRAISPELPTALKRANSRQSTSIYKRVVRKEEPAALKRAARNESPVGNKRACSGDLPNERKCAELFKSPNGRKRARSPQLSEIAKRFLFSKEKHMSESPKQPRKPRKPREPKPKKEFKIVPLTDEAALRELKHQLRALVRGFYELQHMRIITGQQILAALKVLLGIPPGTKEELSADEVKEMLARITASHKLITDGAAQFLKDGRVPFEKFQGNELISTYTMYSMVSNYLELVDQEQRELNAIRPIVHQFPIWSWLGSHRGIKETISAVIISEFDITKARYVSSLWKYAGLDIGPDGKGRNKTKEHMVKVTYIDKNGKKKVRDSITFNTWLRSKLLFVLGGSLLKSHNERYSPLYYNYKHRMENHPLYGPEAGKAACRRAREEEAAKRAAARAAGEEVEDDEDGGETKAKKSRPVKDIYVGRRHLQAVRYMVKMFLIDLYKAWRPLAGLEVFDPYAQSKLGRDPHSGPVIPPKPSAPVTPVATAEDDEDDMDIVDKLMLDAEMENNSPTEPEKKPDDDDTVAGSNQ